VVFRGSTDARPERGKAQGSNGSRGSSGPSYPSLGGAATIHANRLAGGAKSQKPEPKIIGPSPSITPAGPRTTVANTENVRGRREAQRHVGAWPRKWRTPAEARTTRTVAGSKLRRAVNSEPQERCRSSSCDVEWRTSNDGSARPRQCPAAGPLRSTQVRSILEEPVHE
jgi:hypothetical protein